jgi:hypothetical protein
MRERRHLVVEDLLEEKPVIADSVETTKAATGVVGLRSSDGPCYIDLRSACFVNGYGGQYGGRP